MYTERYQSTQYLENHLLDICQTYETGIPGGVDDSCSF